MTGLRPALAGYLDLRRGLGFKLDRDAKLLEQFITCLEQRGTGTVTMAGALAWATLPAGGSPGWLRMRITVVRGFAAYLATLDPATEVPPAGLLPGGTHRAVPYLYSATDIAALLAQAERLRTPLRTATIQRLIGLLAVTGMRIGEALSLDDGGFDAGHGMLVVRHAKLGKHRLLPVHPTTVTALQSYRQLRDQASLGPAVRSGPIAPGRRRSGSGLRRWATSRSAKQKVSENARRGGVPRGEPRTVASQGAPAAVIGARPPTRGHAE